MNSVARTLGNRIKMYFEPWKGSAIGERFQRCDLFYLLNSKLGIKVERATR